MKRIYGRLPAHDYATEFSVSIVYVILTSTTMNFFYQLGNIYSNGPTGLAQILTALSTKIVGFNVPVSVTLYLLNVPLFFTVWEEIGKKFIIFTFITVTLTLLFMHIAPRMVTTQDLIIYAIFGRAISGLGVGSVLKNGVPSGGLDILGITIRKKAGHSTGSISAYFNALTVFVTGYLLGWQYMFHNVLSIFVSGKVTDIVYTKQKKMQVMTIAKNPNRVVDEIQKKTCRGITITHEAEGTCCYGRQAVLLTIVTCFELPSLETTMKESDPNAFASISDDVKVLGRFCEEDYR